MAANRIIMLDTGSSPTEEILKSDDIRRMGMKIFLDGKTLIDGEEIDKETYYSIIEKAGDFNTSPPLVWEIRKIYERLKSEGARELVGVHVSSAMSKLIPTCVNAAKLVSGLDVRIIDTLNISAGAGLVAEKVVDLLRRGRSVDQVEALMPEIRASVHFQISLSTLSYLVKNKRIGRAQGLVGNLLRMRPILGIDGDGYLVPVGKERGKENLIERISESAVRFLEKRPYNIRIYLEYGLDRNKRQVEAVYEAFMKKFKGLDIGRHEARRSRLWPTVANLSGPETYGFAVYGEKRPIE